MVNFQIGKAGITKNFLESLSKTFKKHKLVKITILPSATRDKLEANKMAQELCAELKHKEEKDFTVKIIGFTIVIKKWRKKLK